MEKDCKRWGIVVGHHQTSEGESKRQPAASEFRRNRSTAGSTWRPRALLAALAAMALLLCPGAPLHAQGQKSKVPLVGKLTAKNRQQVYSGEITSLDLKQRILNVESMHGQNTAIFPFKKNVRVEGVNGKRMDLTELTPGTNVLIYFAQKSGERRIKNIVVLSPGKKQAKSKPAPSS